jgi:diguanylate cyclase (GGDEF)-like protein
MSGGQDDPDDPTRQTAREWVASALSGQKSPCLVVLAGDQVGQMFMLSSEEMVLGREANADVQILDDGVSRQHAAVRTSQSGIVIEDMGSRNGTSVNGKLIKRHKLAEGDKIELGTATMLKFTFHDELDANFQRQMYDSALRDGLTGAFNKRYFLQRLDNELRFALRHRSPLSLILLDIDHFKNVNDTHGHLAGDAVLVELARRVRDAIRVEDVFARYGGEEFAVICRAVVPEQARVLAERLRTSVADAPFELGKGSLEVTISLGIAGLPDAQAADPVTLERVADGALYAAKHGGRNRVEIATEPPAPSVPSSVPPGPNMRATTLTLEPGAQGHQTRKFKVPSIELIEAVRKRAGNKPPK